MKEIKGNTAISITVSAMVLVLAVIVIYFIVSDSDSADTPAAKPSAAKTGTTAKSAASNGNWPKSVFEKLANFVGFDTSSWDTDSGTPDAPTQDSNGNPQVSYSDPTAFPTSVPDGATQNSDGTWSVPDSSTIPVNNSILSQYGITPSSNPLNPAQY